MGAGRHGPHRPGAAVTNGDGPEAEPRAAPARRLAKGRPVVGTETAQMYKAVAQRSHRHIAFTAGARAPVRPIRVRSGRLMPLLEVPAATSAWRTAGRAPDHQLARQAEVLWRGGVAGQPLAQQADRLAHHYLDRLVPAQPRRKLRAALNAVAVFSGSSSPSRPISRPFAVAPSVRRSWQEAQEHAPPPGQARIGEEPPA
jgi:hypothetical protein